MITIGACTVYIHTCMMGVSCTHTHVVGFDTVQVITTSTVLQGVDGSVRAFLGPAYPHTSGGCVLYIHTRGGCILYSSSALHVHIYQ